MASLVIGQEKYPDGLRVPTRYSLYKLTKLMNNVPVGINLG